MNQKSCWHCQEAVIVYPYQALCGKFSKPFPEGFLCSYWEQEDEITKQQNAINWTEAAAVEVK